jgi:hypothetical protein
MTAIWRNDGSGWRLLAPSSYPSEAALHTLVEEAPHILPLAGAPRLVIVGREVTLGNGYADLIAVEPSGRVAVIEVKLASNGEARRAVVAQVLTYAAYLRGLSPADFEAILAKHLQARGYQDLAQAVSATDQEGAFDFTSFTAGLTDSLTRGRFRLVIVLDAAPRELVRLVGYLESVTDGLLIDLVTVTAYEVNGSQVLVPQRIEDDQQPPAAASQGATNAVTAAQVTGFVEGADDFIRAIDQAPESTRAQLHRLAEWGLSLEREGLVKLGTYHGKDGGLTLLPRLLTDDVGLVTIYNYTSRGAFLQFWRSVFLRRAPTSLTQVEQAIAPTPVGQGNWTNTITDELLRVLTQAYREANQQTISD